MVLNQKGVHFSFICQYHRPVNIDLPDHICHNLDTLRFIIITTTSCPVVTYFSFWSVLDLAHCQSNLVELGKLLQNFGNTSENSSQHLLYWHAGKHIAAGQRLKIFTQNFYWIVIWIYKAIFKREITIIQISLYSGVILNNFLNLGVIVLRCLF